MAQQSAANRKEAKMSNCPKCQLPCEQGEKFCRRCGAELQPAAIPSLICPRCGNIFDEGVIFCPVDGVKLVNSREYGKFRPTGGKTPNSEITAHARAALKGRWGLAIGTFLVYAIVVGSVQYIPVIGSVASILITGAMFVGLSIFTLSIVRNQDANLGQIFEGFQKFGVALGTYIIQNIFIFLWTLLLIVPGIIATLAYSQTYYIIAENNSIGPLEAITKSKKIMRGNKGKLCCLGLRFFGWSLLCLLTLGIGYIWLFPYMQVSFARFYTDVATQ